MNLRAMLAGVTEETPGRDTHASKAKEEQGKTKDGSNLRTHLRD